MRSKNNYNKDEESESVKNKSLSPIFPIKMTPN